MNLQALSSGLVFAIASLIIAIASLAVAFVFYRKSKREKRPCLSVTRQTVIENRAPILPGLSVHYKDEEQQTITVAKVAFWNRGAETISGTDIAPAKPLCIVVNSGVEVLSASVLKRTDSANQFHVGMPERGGDGVTRIPLTFDFLDQGDGALVQVVHNGEEKTLVFVEGKIKGAREVSLQFEPSLSQKRFEVLARKMASRTIGVAIALTYFALGVVLIIVGIRDVSVPIIALGILVAFFSFVGFSVVLRRRIPLAISPIEVEPTDKQTPCHD